MFLMQQTPEELQAAIDQDFGQLVKKRREELKLSQRDFAARLNSAGMVADAPAISRIENGARSVRLPEAMAIATALDTQLVDLLGLRAFQSRAESLQAQIDAVLSEHRKVTQAVFSAASSLGSLSDYARGVIEEIDAFGGSPLPKSSLAAGRFLYMRQEIERIASSTPGELLREMVKEVDRHYGEHPEEG